MLLILQPYGYRWQAGEDRADRIFGALADRTRRDIVRRAMGGTLSVSGLARLYPMSTTAVQKHVAVLAEAGLVHRTRRGREQLVQTNIDTVAEAGAAARPIRAAVA